MAYRWPEKSSTDVFLAGNQWEISFCQFEHTNIRIVVWMFYVSLSFHLGFVWKQNHSLLSPMVNHPLNHPFPGALKVQSCGDSKHRTVQTEEGGVYWSLQKNLSGLI